MISPLAGDDSLLTHVATVYSHQFALLSAWLRWARDVKRGKRLQRRPLAWNDLPPCSTAGTVDKTDSPIDTNSASVHRAAFDIPCEEAPVWLAEAAEEVALMQAAHATSDCDIMSRQHIRAIGNPLQGTPTTP